VAARKIDKSIFDLKIDFSILGKIDKSIFRKSIKSIFDLIRADQIA